MIPECAHGVPFGCALVCACGHRCDEHDEAGCHHGGHPAVEVLLTAILGPVRAIECECLSFDAAGPSHDKV